jgi:ribosomal protein S18 acetylase RimI-like enzyme
MVQLEAPIQTQPLTFVLRQRSHVGTYIKDIHRLLPQLSPTCQLPSEETVANHVLDPQINLVLLQPAHRRTAEAMGFIYFQWRPEGWKSEIHTMVVDQEFRRQGFGETVLLHLLELAKNHADMFGRFSVELTCRPDRRSANAMYIKHGFQLTTPATVAPDGGHWGTNHYRKQIESRTLR